MPAVHVADIGKKAKGFLGGDAATGNFVLNPKLTIASTTASGVALTVTAAQKGEKLDSSVKAAWSCKKYSVDATADPAGKVSVNASVSDVAPGVKVSTSFALPDPVSTAKLSAEYSSALLAGKATVSLAPAAPALELAVGSAVRGLLVGAELGYDVAKSNVTKSNVILGYHAADFQASATLADQFSSLKLAYMHTLSPSASVGAELGCKLADCSTPHTFALAYGRTLAGGAVAKFKFDNAGALSATYQTKLAGGEKLAGSLQLQTTDLSKGPKYGFALDLA